MRHRRWRDQRGGALVEAAIVLPVVIMLLFGIIEYGFVFKDELTISNAVRAGARIGAADGVSMANYSADYDILTAVKSGSGALGSGSIVKVIVYNGSASSSSLPSQCPSTATVGVAGYCNVYLGSVVNAASLDTTKFGCGAGSLDQYWCPTARSDVQTSPSYLGVYMQVNHNYITQMFGSSRTLSDNVVFRVEPQS